MATKRYTFTLKSEEHGDVIKEIERRGKSHPDKLSGAVREIVSEHIRQKQGDSPQYSIRDIGCVFDQIWELTTLIAERTGPPATRETMATILETSQAALKTSQSAVKNSQATLKLLQLMMPSYIAVFFSGILQRIIELHHNEDFEFNIPSNILPAMERLAELYGHNPPTDDETTTEATEDGEDNGVEDWDDDDEDWGR